MSADIRLFCALAALIHIVQSEQFTWHDPSCSGKCMKPDYAANPPLLVVSMDGFANEYRKRRLVPSIETLGSCGASAKWMFPVYPTKTFPNHYSIATGLYPESHGIVDNNVYDPELGLEALDVRTTSENKYYWGEPIWSAAIKERKRTLCIHWAGCAFEISGHRPDENIPFDQLREFPDKIRTIVNRLTLPADKRPDLIMAYFMEPDEVGHMHKNDAEVDAQLRNLDKIMNELFSGLHAAGILDCVNIVVVSDHGMQDLNKNVFLDQQINIRGMEIASGVIGRVHMAESGVSAEQLIDHIRCKETDIFQVYDRERLPLRYHYAKTPRCGDVIFEGMPGTIVWNASSHMWPMTADHGYDYLYENMHAIFFARGPNIIPKSNLEPFQNVELYALFKDLLRLQRDIPTNGTTGFWNDYIRGIDGMKAADDVKPLTPCPMPKTRKLSRMVACGGTPECSIAACDAEKIAQTAVTTASHSPRTQLLHTIPKSQHCLIDWSPDFALIDSSNKPEVATMAVEFLRNDDFLTNRKDVGPNCQFYDKKFDTKCYFLQPGKEFEQMSITANPKSPFASNHRLQFLVRHYFAHGPFASLQQLTKSYVRRFGKILSFTAAVYDFDRNGVADDETVLSPLFSEHRVNPRSPSHIARVLIRCLDSKWDEKRLRCLNPTSTSILAFILPNTNSDTNCLPDAEYLRKNTARLKDVELLTGLRFFADPTDQRHSIRWRTEIISKLW